MLKNWSHKYFSHYIIKFIGFMPIYLAINLDIVSSVYVFLAICTLDLSIYCQLVSIKLFYVPFKKKKKSNL